MSSCGPAGVDRKSTRLNSSHHGISYAVFCLKKNSSCCVGRMTTWREDLVNKCYRHTWMCYVSGLPRHLDYPEMLGLFFFKRMRDPQNFPLSPYTPPSI